MHRSLEWVAIKSNHMRGSLQQELFLLQVFVYIIVLFYFFIAVLHK
jgi:hypothetical protein